MMIDVVSKFSNTVRLHLPLSTKQAGPRDVHTCCCISSAIWTHALAQVFSLSAARIFAGCAQHSSADLRTYYGYRNLAIALTCQWPQECE